MKKVTQSDEASLVLRAEVVPSAPGAFGRAFEQLRSSLVRRGWRTTARAIAANLDDYWFDVRHGTDTAGRVELDVLDILSENKARGVSYMPTHARAFGRLIEALNLPADSVFVDLGCGKGKVLLLACRHRFKRIVGVEFSRELCAVAQRNVDRFLKRARVTADIEVVERDAADYAIGADENVFFMFHPFDAVVMSRVLRNIQESLARSQRAIWIVYNNPVCRGVIQRSAGFVEAGSYVHGSSQFGIYVSRTSA